MRVHWTNTRYTSINFIHRNSYSGTVSTLWFVLKLEILGKTRRTLAVPCLNCRRVDFQLKCFFSMLAFLNAVSCYVYVCMAAHINRYASQESGERERARVVDGSGVRACRHKNNDNDERNSCTRAACKMERDIVTQRAHTFWFLHFSRECDIVVFFECICFSVFAEP